MKVQIEKDPGKVGTYNKLKDILSSDSDAKTMQHCLTISSHIWNGTVNGETVCVWGLIPPSLMSMQAYLWLFTTDKADDYQFLLVRHSQMAVEEMLKEYDTLIGDCLVGAKRSIRWITWLGGEFDKSDGKKMRFHIRKK